MTSYTDQALSTLHEWVQSEVLRKHCYAVAASMRHFAQLNNADADLWGAVVCEVPLLDMRRFHKLLAGASWMDEYGNPDKPEDWSYLQKYSPYQNVRKDAHYPRGLFTTSTRDDRVHPGHARKMVARMKEQGHDVLYYENIEGGHGGAANNQQAAKFRNRRSRKAASDSSHPTSIPAG